MAPSSARTMQQRGARARAAASLPRESCLIGNLSHLWRNSSEESRNSLVAAKRVPVRPALNFGRTRAGLASSPRHFTPPVVHSCVLIGRRRIPEAPRRPTASARRCTATAPTSGSGTRRTRCAHSQRALRRPSNSPARRATRASTARCTWHGICRTAARRTATGRGAARPSCSRRRTPPSSSPRSTTSSRASAPARAATSTSPRRQSGGGRASTRPRPPTARARSRHSPIRLPAAPRRCGCTRVVTE